MGSHHSTRRTLPSATLLGGALALLAAGCTRIDGLAPVTTQGDAVHWLFMFELGLAFLVAGAVGCAVVYAMFKFRDRPGAPDPPQIHGNTRLELAWTGAPALLLVLLFVLMVRSMSTVEAEAATSLRVRVIAHQWWFEYQYPELGIITANELHLPVGQPVRLELESADVVHNFWIPQFGWKKDNTPNRTTHMNVVVNEAGTFDGACTEFCGTQHAWMRIRAVASPPAEFQAWVTRNQRPAQSSARGQQVFQQNTCVSCHAIQGVSDARVGPDLSHVGSRTTLGAGVLGNSPDELRSWIVEPGRIKPGALMPGYPDLPEDDLRALVEYLGGLK
ncbi:MAG: cytochrome c oxidase subunit II [Chloroflexi bacterium]|nr:cytochrome c oxidase subunit II [Chloroflexota bacterium]